MERPYTPISFSLAGLAFVVGIFRYRLFDLRPVVRDVIVDWMQDAILTLDVRNRIVDLNPAARALFGGSRDFIGQPAIEVLDFWADWMGQLSLVPELHKEITLPTALSLRDYEAHVSTLTDPQGRLTGRVILFHDVTESRQALQALQERTAELETRNAELDAFAHTVAHDLKTPLSGLMGYSHLLRVYLDTLSPAEIQSNLEIIETSGQKMANIIDELLLLSSVRQSEEILVAPLDMAEVVTEARQRLRQPLAEMQAEIVEPEHWPLALGYSAWIEEVWVNYLSNALKYGGRPPRVELGWEWEKAEGGRMKAETENLADGISSSFLRFWVRDNGPGLTPEQQAQLFTEFTRLHLTRAEGHGVGLSIVRRIVERLGGEVGVESASGAGSTFYFTLPGVPPEP